MTYYKKYEPLWGSWYITKLIGQGNFGKVFEIERQEFGEIYRAALKIITVPQNESEIKSVMASGMDQASVAEYFEGMAKEIVSEFKLMSTLKGNSCVVSYEDHQVITHESGLGRDILIRMELLTPLIDYIQTNKMTRRDIIKLGIDMCNALELCQKRNIIHRDIKPENIFVSEDGHFKLGDFGIARTIEKTSGGLSKKGTYTYMAPEVYKGEEYGSSVDIYSLGIVMYRLLNNNRTPFLPPLPEKIKHSDVDKALSLRFGGKIIPKPAEADGRLAEIVLKACAYNPKDRYSSPMEMRTELEAILYEAVESKVIYPKGDEVVVKPNEYVGTEGGVAPFETMNDEGAVKNEKTIVLFGSIPQEVKGKQSEQQLKSKDIKLKKFQEQNEKLLEEELAQQSESGEDRWKKNIKYAIWGIVTCVTIVFIFTIAFRTSEVDTEVDIVEQPTETTIEEVIDEEYVVAGIPNEYVDDAEILDETPFNLDVWDDSIQLEAEGITIDIPIPPGDVTRHYENRFLVSTYYYSVSGAFGLTNSFEEWSTMVIEMIRNSDVVVDFSYKINELEGLYLIAMRREIELDEGSRFDTGFFLAFKHRGHIFDMSITLGEGLEEQEIGKEFLEAYGINKFVDAGLLDMGRGWQMQDGIDAAELLGTWIMTETTNPAHTSQLPEEAISIIQLFEDGTGTQLTFMPNPMTLLLGIEITWTLQENHLITRTTGHAAGTHFAGMPPSAPADVIGERTIRLSGDIMTMEGERYESTYLRHATNSIYGGWVLVETTEPSLDESIQLGERYIWIFDDGTGAWGDLDFNTPRTHSWSVSNGSLTIDWDDGESETYLYTMSSFFLVLISNDGTRFIYVRF